MSPRLRKVTTASGATAVQIVRKHRGKVTVLEHLGSAHTEAELTALLTAGEEKLADYGTAEQLELELGLPADTAAPPRARTVVGSRSSILIDAITQSWKRLGFGEVVNDNAFFHLVLARLVEPTSKADSLRVLAELDIEPPHHNTFLNCLVRANERDYRGKIAEKCFAHSVATTGISPPLCGRCGSSPAEWAGRTSIPRSLVKREKSRLSYCPTDSRGTKIVELRSDRQSHRGASERLADTAGSRVNTVITLPYRIL